MDFNEYQKKAHETAIYPTEIGLTLPMNSTGYMPYSKLSWIYPALGLAGESGELLNKLKKVIRDQNGIISTGEEGEMGEPIGIQYDDIFKEIGDILWYCAELATIFNVELDTIALANINKLAIRAKRNQITGSGDSR